MGTVVFDVAGKNIGMGSQVYLRSDKPVGDLLLRWGKRDNQQCRLRYRGQPISDAPIQLLNAPCR